MVLGHFLFLYYLWACKEQNVNLFLPGMCYAHFGTAGFLLEFMNSVETEQKRGERIVLDMLYGYMVPAT